MTEKKEKYNQYVEQRKQLMARKAVMDAEHDQLDDQVADIDIEMGLLLKEIEHGEASKS